MNKKKGFTLIELLVVVAIIGLLATLSIVALNNARARARDAKRIGDIKQIQTALELYYNDLGTYPPSMDFTTGTSSIASNSIVYMSQVPKAPLPYDGTSCSGNINYTYAVAGTGGATQTYQLVYCLGSATGGLTAGIGTATPAGIK